MLVGNINSLINYQNHLPNCCYANLFMNCSGLVSPPELPAIALSTYCYYRTFKDCTSLSAAPELPVSSLVYGCYRGMFAGCTALSSAPELPATELVNECYYEMFWGCSSLILAPELPAIELANKCYYRMFKSCISLSSINVEFTEWSPSNATLEWVDDVGTNGTFTCPYGLSVLSGNDYIPNNWIINKPLTFIASTSSTIDLVKYEGDNNYVDLTEIKVNKNDTIWEPLTGQIILNEGEYVSFINKNNTLSKSNLTYVNFEMSGEISGAGNIQSLLNYSESVPSYGFYQLFNDCKSLISTPKFPAKTVGAQSYYNMFKGCINLEQASEIGVETMTGGSALGGMFWNCSSLTVGPSILKPLVLKSNCYISMFNGCTLLEQAPELPATSLVTNCYKNMFKSCSSLKSIKVHFTNWTTSASSTTTAATATWVSNVSSNGTFNCPSDLEPLSGNSNIPNNWVVEPF